MDWRFCTRIIMGCQLIMSFLVVEVNSLTFAPQYGIFSHLHLSKEMGAFMAGLMSAAFTTMRGAGILISVYVPHGLMIMISLFTIAASNFILMYSGSREVLVWISMIGMGIGHGGVIAALFSFLQQKINLTNKITGLFMSMGSVGAIIASVVTGPLIQSHPVIFVLMNLIGIGSCLLALIEFKIIELFHATRGP